MADLAQYESTVPTKLWVPRHVRITRAAADFPHTAEIVRRCEAAGVTDIVVLSGNQLTGLRGESERETYARAKTTLAVVVAPPGALKPQPIPPSADWRIDLARGCPAHCQYCYLAGSLTGPPVTRVYANLDDVLAGIGTHAGRGSVTSGTQARRAPPSSCPATPIRWESSTSPGRCGQPSSGSAPASSATMSSSASPRSSTMS